LLHSAAVLEGQSGGPLIALDDYFQDDKLILAPDAPLPFIGMSLQGTEHGYNVALSVEHRAFRGALEDAMGELAAFEATQAKK